MEEETHPETQEAAVQAQVEAFVKEKLAPEQIRALPRKNQRLVSEIEVLRVAWIGHFRQMAVLFNISPDEAESRWNEIIGKLKLFADASQLFPPVQ